MSNSIVIIEDEARTRAFLKTFIEEHYQWLDVIGEARGVTTGLKLIREKSPDIVLLDIEMQDGTGFDLLDKLNDDQQLVIFVTAYSEYAIHAIKKNAFDYIEKPIDPEELGEALYRAKQSLERRATGSPSYSTEKKEVTRLAIPTRQGMRYINSANICYVKADGSYSYLHLANQDKPVLVSKKLKEIQQTLEILGFIRPNHSYLVNLDFILELRKTDGGSVLLEDGTEISFSKHYKEQALDRLKEESRILGQGGKSPLS